MSIVLCGFPLKYGFIIVQVYVVRTQENARYDDYMNH